MSAEQSVQGFICQRMNEALDEILSVVEKSFIKYEQDLAVCQEVISNQRALLCERNNLLLELPGTSDTFTQQLMVSEENPEHQDQQEQHACQVEEVVEAEQLQDLDEAELITLTYSCGRVVNQAENVDLPVSEVEPGPGPAPADPDREVYLVSSETEDSADYGKDPTDPTSTSQRLKPKMSHRPGFSCQTCGQTFRAHRVLFRHVKAHLQEDRKVCGLCGEAFETISSLKHHIKTHCPGGRHL